MKKWVKITVLVCLAIVFAVALTLYLTGDPDDKTSRNTIMLIVMMVVATAIAAILLYGKKPDNHMQKPMALRPLIDGALCIALAFVLSYIKLYSMPTGGSITLASMLPLCIYANRYGVTKGLMACGLYGVLQFIQNPMFLSVPQVLLEYPLAFGVIAIGGVFKRLPLTILLGCFLRFLCHFFASVVFWSEYLDAGHSMWIASLIYNGAYMGVDTAICLVLSFLPPLNKALDAALPKRIPTANAD